MIVAIAGHVDHGKTMLVKQLTGVDTDRLEEEKRRGLSISLGFAHRELCADVSVGFVDVPGHKNFINTMIAGVSSIDLALIVIAVDDGPMPQTIEHFDILRLLGVKDFVIVLTKIDKADDFHQRKVLRRVKLSIPNFANLFLINSLKPNSSLNLWKYLSAKAKTLPDKSKQGHFRLSIDRSFLIKGIGLIVTGTVTSGIVTVGEELRILPGSHRVRVKQIHAFDKKVDRAHVGQRCALNISGIKKSQITRGDWLVSKLFAKGTPRFDARFTLLSSAPFSLKHRTHIKLYIGAKQQRALLIFHDRKKHGLKLSPGSTALVEIITQSDLACCRGDKFIVRDDSESFTLGGGVVLDPAVDSTKNLTESHRAFLSEKDDHPPETLFSVLILNYKQVISVKWFKHMFNLQTEDFEKISHSFSQENRLFRFSWIDEEYIVLKRQWECFEKFIQDSLYLWHKNNHVGPGIKECDLRSQFQDRFDNALFESVVSQLVKTNLIERSDGYMNLQSFRFKLDISRNSNWSLIENALSVSSSQIVAFNDLCLEINIANDTISDVLGKAVKEKRVYQLGAQRYILRERLRALMAATRDFAEREPSFSITQIKEQLGLGRNSCIDLMEYFDSIGFTRRSKDRRSVLRPKYVDRLL